MTHLLIRHKVRDYDKWKKHFDAHASERFGHGCLGGTIYRTVSDPNDIAIIFAWSDADGARSFVESSELRQTMRDAGVINPPELRFMTVVEDFA